MKKIFTKMMLWAVAATAMVSCANDVDDAMVNGGELTQKITLSAEKPATVRTEMEGTTPYWSVGDKIGVYTAQVDDGKEYTLTNDATERKVKTTFTGTTALSNTLYVFYPSKGYGVAAKGAKCEIPANQNPTANSFDGAADIMIAKPVTLDAEGNQLSDLEFARLGAIVKVVLKDNTSTLAGQHVKTLAMTAASNLAGRVYLDVVNQKLNEEDGLYYGQSPTVTATYTESTHYDVNGENGTYFIVYPQVLASGSKLSFEASTEGYAITKEISLSKDIDLAMGKVTTLNVSLAGENIVASATGLALPFVDDFTWAEGDANNGTAVTASQLPKNANGEDMYSSVNSKVYPVGGELKFGSSNTADANRGILTTADLNLSQPFTVIVDAKSYGSDANCSLSVTVGETTQTSAVLTSTYQTYIFKFEAAGAKEKVSFKINTKRGYIDNLNIIAGHEDVVVPPVLTAETPDPISAAGLVDATIKYNVKNPVDGVSVQATTTADWITNFDYSVAGEISFDVSENPEENEREAEVILSYEGAADAKVTVKQVAKQPEGGDTGGDDVVASWKKESWSTFTTTSTSYGSHTINGDLGTWTCVGCSAYENTSTQVVKDTGFKYVTLGDSDTEKAKVTSPTFATGIQGLKFKYYANNTARPVKVTIYENGAVSKTQTITPSAKNTLLSAEVTVTTTGSTYITFESTSTSRRVSIGEIEILY